MSHNFDIDYVSPPGLELGCFSAKLIIKWVTRRITILNGHLAFFMSGKALVGAFSTHCAKSFYIDVKIV